MDVSRSVVLRVLVEGVEEVNFELAVDNRHGEVLFKIGEKLTVLRTSMKEAYGITKVLEASLMKLKQFFVVCTSTSNLEEICWKWSNCLLH